MTGATLRRTIGLGLAVASLACTDHENRVEPSEGTPRGATHILDAAGVSHSISDPVTRIISLVPSATETLVAIGAADLLIARTDFDNIEAVKDLPSIGGGLQPNLEAILALAPDLVIYFFGPSDETTRRRLTESGIQAFGIRPDRVADIRKGIADLGALSGRASNANALLVEIDQGLAEVAARVQGRERVRVVFTLGGDPPWVAGPASYVQELIALAGGQNVFSDLDALYGPISIEEFLVRDIDLVLARLRAELPAQVEEHDVRRVPGYVEIPGPRLHLAARTIAEAIHPDAFR